MQKKLFNSKNYCNFAPHFTLYSYLTRKRKTIANYYNSKTFYLTQKRKMEHWIDKALTLLAKSLEPVPTELNELDWKQSLSPDKERLAEHISAFANYPGGGFLAFGIEDSTAKTIGINKDEAHEIVRKLSSIGRNRLEPAIQLQHQIAEYKGKPILFFHIPESNIKPVHIKNKSIEEAFIRSGGCTHKASRQELAAMMMNSQIPTFEDLHATRVKSEDEVFDLLDVKNVIRLLEKPMPQNRKEALKILVDKKMLSPVDDTGYYITNLGALTAAKNLNDFESLSRKAIRLIEYKGKTKRETIKEYPNERGYAVGFEDLISSIMRLQPGNETMGKALRKKHNTYPEIAIRELTANCIIHQDFSIRGASSMIELFEDRIEITNPGRLIPEKTIDRLIRTSPESRNETLASEFRKLHICEERGSGFEKAISAIEEYGLPPLKMQEIDNSFRVTMYKPKTFAQLTQAERIEACYQHAVICYYSIGGMTNVSLRERFKMHEKQRPQVSLVIKEALALGKIKPKNPESASKKFVEYIPIWG